VRRAVQLLTFCVFECYAQQAPLKIAVLNLQAALASTTEGRKIYQELNAKAEPKRKDFETRQNEIGQLEDQLKSGGSLLTEEKKEQLTRTLDEKKRRLQRDSEDAEE